MSVSNIEGSRFGRLIVLSRVENDKHGNARWLCRCDCGTEKIVCGSSLRKGVIVSCGCYHKDELKQRLTTHGMAGTRIHNIWNHMVQRCTNKNDNAYKYYGGRGISVCNEWKSFESFLSWSNENGYNDDLTIDRIDTDKGYFPENCRWVSRLVQQNNRHRVHLYTIRGETKSIAEWCRVYDVPHERVRRRVVKEGWDIEKALTTPALDAHGNPRR